MLIYDENHFYALFIYAYIFSGKQIGRKKGLGLLGYLGECHNSNRK